MDALIEGADLDALRTVSRDRTSHREIDAHDPIQLGYALSPANRSL
jgi:hypothetical protein